jgi:hypothetical protein
MGASAFAKGDDCPVVFEPVVEFWPGNDVLPISFESAVTGAATDAGNEGSGFDAGPGGVGVDDPVAPATAAATAF